MTQLTTNDKCEIFVDHGQPVTHKTHIKNYPFQLIKTFNSWNINQWGILDHYQQVRHKLRILNNHTCMLTNACDSMNVNQWNEPVEDWYIVKFIQNKNSK